MGPIAAITTLGELVARIDQMREAIDDQADAIRHQWKGLGIAGGQREDHAATMLQALRPSFVELERFARACQVQLDKYRSDPYAD